MALRGFLRPTGGVQLTLESLVVPLHGTEELEDLGCTIPGRDEVVRHLAQTSAEEPPVLVSVVEEPLDPVPRLYCFAVARRRGRQTLQDEELEFEENYDGDRVNGERHALTVMTRLTQSGTPEDGLPLACELEGPSAAIGARTGAEVGATTAVGVGAEEDVLAAEGSTTTSTVGARGASVVTTLSWAVGPGEPDTPVWARGSTRGPAWAPSSGAPDVASTNDVSMRSPGASSSGGLVAVPRPCATNGRSSGASPVEDADALPA
jgi:hypothetical protein